MFAILSLAREALVGRPVVSVLRFEFVGPAVLLRSLSLKSGTEPIMGLVIIRIQPQGFAVRRNHTVPVALLPKRGGEVGVRALVPRV